MGVNFLDQVRERAYHLWTQEGRVHGRAEQHWLQAERDLLAAAPPVTVTSKSKGKRPSKPPTSRPRSRAKGGIEVQVTH